MLRLLETTRFLKDLKRMGRRGKSFERYKKIVSSLVREEALPHSFREHRLRGQWADFWEGHIEPDWLLVYRRTENAIILVQHGQPRGFV